MSDGSRRRQWVEVLKLRKGELEERLDEYDRRIRDARQTLKDGTFPSEMRKHARETVEQLEPRLKDDFSEWIGLDQAIDRERGHRWRVAAVVVALVGSVVLGVINLSITIARWNVHPPPATPAQNATVPSVDGGTPQ